MLKFFRLPFATSGDKIAVPDAVDVNGNVSYTEGFGFDYERQKTDPLHKNIPRDQSNQIYFDITTALAELQSRGVPDFITSALNGGTAYSYAVNAVVRWTDNDLYVSLVAANTATPADATKWALLPTPGRVRDGFNTIAASAGTADAITLALTPTQTTFAAGPTWWRATAANATTTPTVQRDGLAAKTLVKGNNVPLVAGDIAGAGMWMCSQYDATLDKEVLLNPAFGVSSSLSIASTAEAQAGTDNTKVITPLRMREGFNASGSAPVYACRAWVDFNGTGTPAIKASGNVSSLTDNGTGDWTVNFTTALPDANYAACLSTLSQTAGNTQSVALIAGVIGTGPTTKTTTALRVIVGHTGTGAPTDAADVNLSIFR